MLGRVTPSCPGGVWGDMKPVLAAFLALALAGGGTLGTACYQDDALPGVQAVAPTQVYLTDDPFPYDTVASVDIYVSRIEASTSYPIDTLTPGAWTVVAEPKRRFDLLQLQQGTTARIGEAALDAGKYTAIRLAIDVDSSAIRYLDGSEAVVHWGASGEIVVFTQVESPLAVPATGAEIVIDFDLGRSFPYNLFGTNEFTFLPWLRAVNAAATGAIAGDVSATDLEGQASVSLPNADVSVYGGDPLRPSTWYLMASGHTDGAGHYTIGFLTAGTYNVRIEQPSYPSLAPVVTPAVPVSVGTTTSLSVVLPPAGAGGAFINITGPSSVLVGNTIVLRAAVGDSQGTPITNPVITWRTRADSIVALLDSSYGDTLAFVLGARAGTTFVSAQSGALLDSVQVEVLPQTSVNPVASVTVSPASRSLVVGDSTFFYATLRDASGQELTNRQISWFLADSSGVVDLLVSVGPTAVIKVARSGTTAIRATSEGKVGSATITVQ